MTSEEIAEHGERIFVYGTLRVGASNHFRMGRAHLLGPAMMKGKLYKIGWYPGLVLQAGVGEVVGEVYGVSPSLMGELDEFEGFRGTDQDEFVRVRAHALVTGKEMELWVYEYRGSVEERCLIESGDWLEVA